MNNFYTHLRIDIEKRIGFKIVSTTDAMLLLKILQENNIENISLSTLRRFWNLIPMRKANNATLDVLARFLDYKSFLDYVKQKNNYEKWLVDAEIQKLKFKETISADEFKFLSLMIATSESNHIFVSLFEHAFHHEKWDYIVALFDDNNITLLKKDDPINHFQTNTAYLIFIFLYSIPKTNFISKIDKLLVNKNFRDNVIYIYIDVMGLNKRYGAILTEIQKLSLTNEERLFLNLINGLKLCLNKANKIPEITCLNVDELHTFPDVLIGRYYGYQMLYAEQENCKETEEIVWSKFLSLIKTETHIRQYFHEFIHALLLIKKIENLNYLLENYFEYIIDKLHLHSYLDLFIYNLIDVMVCYKNNDLKRANHIFNNLDSNTTKYSPSYTDYYVIFYAITGYHLATQLEEKNVFKLRYIEYAKITKFTLFDLEFLETYFD